MDRLVKRFRNDLNARGIFLLTVNDILEFKIMKSRDVEIIK